MSVYMPGHFFFCFDLARVSFFSFVIPRLPPLVYVRVLFLIVRNFFSTVWAGDRF